MNTTIPKKRETTGNDHSSHRSARRRDQWSLAVEIAGQASMLANYNYFGPRWKSKIEEAPLDCSQVLVGKKPAEKGHQSFTDFGITHLNRISSPPGIFSGQGNLEGAGIECDASQRFLDVDAAMDVLREFSFPL